MSRTRPSPPRDWSVATHNATEGSPPASIRDLGGLGGVRPGPRRPPRPSRRPANHNGWRGAGVHGEEVTDDPFVSRSPTADPRYGPAQGGVLAPDRASVPGQRLLRDAALADPPQHRLARAQAPWRRPPGRPHAG